MKVCPTCQAIFPNGFQFCPRDPDQLVAREGYVPRSPTLVQSSVAKIASLVGRIQSRALAGVRALVPSASPMPTPVRVMSRRPGEKTGFSSIVCH